MKHRVKRDPVTGAWLVRDADGYLVYITSSWAWAMDDALARYADEPS